MAQKSGFVTFYFHFFQTFFSVPIITDTYKEKKNYMDLTNLLEYGKIYALSRWALFGEKKFTNDKTEQLERSVSLIQEKTKCSNKQLIREVAEAYIDSGSFEKHNPERGKRATHIFNFAYMYLEGLSETLEYIVPPTHKDIF